MQKGGVFITVRRGSTRLPAKALREIAGEPVLGYLIERTKAYLPQGVKLLICTTTEPDDGVFDEIAARYGIGVFHGSRDNIILRHYDCAVANGMDFAVNLDGDDILCDPAYIARICGRFLDGAPQQVVKTEGLPFGVNSFGYRTDTLKSILDQAEQSKMETGWGQIVYDADRFDILTIPCEETEKQDGLRLTLDYPEDWEVMERLINAVLLVNRHAPQSAIMDYVRAHPQIMDINRGVDEKYWENFYRHKAADALV